MSTLQQIREDMTHAWDRILEGWDHLFRRARGALTRFTPGVLRVELPKSGSRRRRAIQVTVR